MSVRQRALLLQDGTTAERVAFDMIWLALGFSRWEAKGPI